MTFWWVTFDEYSNTKSKSGLLVIIKPWYKPVKSGVNPALWLVNYKIAGRWLAGWVPSVSTICVSGELEPHEWRIRSWHSWDESDIVLITTYSWGRRVLLLFGLTSGPQYSLVGVLLQVFGDVQFVRSILTKGWIFVVRRYFRGRDNRL